MQYFWLSKKCFILNSDISIWYNSLEHDHSKDSNETDSKNWGINEITKVQIEKLFNNKVTGASRIIYALRKMMDSSDKLMSVPGVIEPSSAQVNNSVNHQLKTKIVKPNLSYADLAKWVSEHSAVPDESSHGANHEHEPFVIDSNIDVNDKVLKASVVRVAISTKYLISLAKKRNHICDDTTWKTNWQGPYLLKC